MSTPTESAIHIYTIGFDRQTFQGFMIEDGDMITCIQFENLKFCRPFVGIEIFFSKSTTVKNERTVEKSKMKLAMFFIFNFSSCIILKFYLSSLPAPGY